MSAKGKIEDFKGLGSDSNRLLWIIQEASVARDKGVKSQVRLIIDNDQTLVIIGDNTDDDECFNLDEFIGQSYGTINLLEVLNINCEYA